MRSALRGPAHQLAVRMRINIYNYTHAMVIIIIAQLPINQPCMHHAPATALAPRVCTLVPFIIILFAVMKSVVTLLDSNFCQAEMHDCKK